MKRTVGGASGYDAGMEMERSQQPSMVFYVSINHGCFGRACIPSYAVPGTPFMTARNCMTSSSVGPKSYSTSFLLDWYVCSSVIRRLMGEALREEPAMVGRGQSVSPAARVGRAMWKRRRGRRGAGRDSGEDGERRLAASKACRRPVAWVAGWAGRGDAAPRSRARVVARTERPPHQNFWTAS